MHYQQSQPQKNFGRRTIDWFATNLPFEVVSQSKLSVKCDFPLYPDSSSNIRNGIESFDKYKAHTPHMKRKHQKLFID